MENLKYRIKLLNKSHDKKQFSCGIDILDNYLIHQASQDIRRHITATYILTEVTSEVVYGYYTLSSTSIELHNLSENLQKKLPRYPLLPATLLGRLAVDKKFQGKKIGELLLVDALKRSLTASQKIGSMAMIVEAKNDDARQFYTHYGFMPFKNIKNRLFLPMQTISQLCGF